MHKSSSVLDSYTLCIVKYYLNVSVLMSDMHVCTMSCLKTKTNPSCVCAPLANKPDSDKKKIQVIRFYFGTQSLPTTSSKRVQKWNIN